MRLLFSLAVLASLATTSGAQDQPSPGKLPVRRVVLFKNGVGYFEHVGNVHANDSVAISFTSGQLNDVLKSLTVLDLNGGRITGIAYGTAAPLSRQMGDACGNLGGKSTQADLLDAVRGSKVEIHGATAFTGRLLGVDQKTRIVSNAQQQVEYVSVLTEGGELRTVELSPSVTLRLLEPGLTTRLDRCLTLAATETNADTRSMIISTEGEGNRRLSVSYISEVPVWKSTYRLVLGKEKALLQGWAIVDNVVGEDWNNVELSLVAGAPQSFIQNLSQPYYAQRPTIALPDTVSTTPQTYEATLSTSSAQLFGFIRDPSGAGIGGAQIIVRNPDGIQVAATTTGSDGKYEIPALPDGSMQLVATAPGFSTTRVNGLGTAAGSQMQQDVTMQVGSVAQTVEVNAQAPPVPPPAASAPAALGRGTQLGMYSRVVTKNSAVAGAVGGMGSGGGYGGGVYRVGQGSFFDAARAQAVGDLFEYKVKDPITILKNRSALAPIVQTSIDAEKVSIWNDNNHLPKPQRAVWINNTSGLTLDGGALSVLEDDTFAGEGIFDPIRPGEKRLISYATDLAVTGSSKNDSESGRVTRVVVAKGILTQHSEIRETKTYTFRNEDTNPRTIVIEHPVRSGYDLISDAKPVETTADFMRLKLNVDAKQTKSLVIKEARQTRNVVALSSLTNDQVLLFVNERSIDPKIEAALREILSRKDAMADLGAKSSDLDNKRQSIFDDQQRLRENIKALKGTPEERPLLERYTHQLNDQETRLEEIEKQKADLEARQEKANNDLTAYIQSLAFDTTL